MLPDLPLVLTIVLFKMPLYMLAGAFMRARAVGEGLSQVPAGWAGPVTFGVVRSVVGAAASIAAFVLLTGPETGVALLWPVQVGGVRIAVWALTLVALHPGAHTRPVWVAGWSLMGTIYSYCLDVPALMLSVELGTLAIRMC